MKKYHPITKVAIVVSVLCISVSLVCRFREKAFTGPAQTRLSRATNTDTLSGLIRDAKQDSAKCKNMVYPYQNGFCRVATVSPREDGYLTVHIKVYKTRSDAAHWKNPMNGVHIKTDGKEIYDPNYGFVDQYSWWAPIQSVIDRELVMPTLGATLFGNRKPQSFKDVVFSPLSQLVVAGLVVLCIHVGFLHIFGGFTRVRLVYLSLLIGGNVAVIWYTATEAYQLYNQNHFITTNMFVASSALFVLVLITQQFVNTWGEYQKRKYPDAIPCNHCDYDLRGNPNGPCPECGASTNTRSKHTLAA